MAESKAQRQHVTEALEKAEDALVSDRVVERLAQVIEKVLDQALAGKSTQQKLLFERLLPVGRFDESKKNGGISVTVVISGDAQPDYTPIEVAPGAVERISESRALPNRSSGPALGQDAARSDVDDNSGASGPNPVGSVATG